MNAQVLSHSQPGKPRHLRAPGSSFLRAALSQGSFLALKGPCQAGMNLQKHCWAQSPGILSIKFRHSPNKHSDLFSGDGLPLSFHAWLAALRMPQEVSEPNMKHVSLGRMVSLHAWL